MHDSLHLDATSYYQCQSSVAVFLDSMLSVVSEKGGNFSPSQFYIVKLVIFKWSSDYYFFLFPSNNSKLLIVKLAIYTVRLILHFSIFFWYLHTFFTSNVQW